jgi:hypothetical protein
VFAWNFTGQLEKLGGTFHVERKDGKVAVLRFNTLRTRHVRFERLDD